VLDAVLGFHMFFIFFAVANAAAEQVPRRF